MNCELLRFDPKWVTPILVLLLVRSVVGGNLDSPGPVSQGSGMYSLQQIYDYLLTGAPLTVRTGFQQPPAGPVSTMKNLREIGDDIKAEFDRCDTGPWDVTEGKKFFCTKAGLWGVRTGTATSGTEGLLRTGQVVSYYPGDDGAYRKGIDFSYTDNGDGTVTDNVTGLMWAADGLGAGCANGVIMTWYDAIDWANNLVFAGYSDWRLPNIRELESITDFDRHSPPLNTAFFTNTSTSIWGYWSSTHATGGVKSTQAAYSVTSNDGEVGCNNKLQCLYMRAVRAGR